MSARGGIAWRKRIWTARAVRARLAGLTGAGSDESNELAHRDWLRRLAEDAECGSRRVIIGDDAQAVAVGAIATVAPNFGALIGIIQRAVRASANTYTALRVPPLLICGPPGIGKTDVCQKLAAALGTHCVWVSMTTVTGVNPLGGVSTIWRSPRIGLLAQALVEGETMQPLIVLDEIDKVFTRVGDSDPLDPLPALLEPATARRFKDEYLEFAADGVLRMATANSVKAISRRCSTASSCCTSRRPPPR